MNAQIRTLAEYSSPTGAQPVLFVESDVQVADDLPGGHVFGEDVDAGLQCLAPA